MFASLTLDSKFSDFPFLFLNLAAVSTNGFSSFITSSLFLKK